MTRNRAPRLASLHDLRTGRSADITKRHYFSLATCHSFYRITPTCSGSCHSQALYQTHLRKPKRARNTLSRAQLALRSVWTNLKSFSIMIAAHVNINSRVACPSSGWMILCWRSMNGYKARRPTRTACAIIFPSRSGPSRRMISGYRLHMVNACAISVSYNTSE